MRCAIFSIGFLVCATAVLAQSADSAGPPKSQAVKEAAAQRDAAITRANDICAQSILQAKQQYVLDLKKLLDRAVELGAAPEAEKLRSDVEAEQEKLDELLKQQPMVAFGPTDAKRIIYLCDASGTMQSAFSSVRDELRRAVKGLLPDQSFNVIFFSGDNVIPFNQEGLVPPSEENKKKLGDFVDDTSPKEGTNPFPALDAAFQSKPEVIYLLTDGLDQVDSLEEVYKHVAKLNADKHVRINTVMLSAERKKDPKMIELLDRIARDNGGVAKVIDKNAF